MIRKLKLLVIEFLIFFLGLFSSRSRNKNNAIDFETDSNVEKVARAYAQDCVDWVASNFDNARIDYEDRNIIAVEDMLADLSKYAKKNSMPRDRLETYTKMFGFYIGEVYRRNHGNVSWGWVTINGEKRHALGNTKSGRTTFWPVVKVQKRIELGAEDNVLHYYQALVKNKI